MTTDPSSRYLERRDRPRFALVVQAAIYVPAGVATTVLTVVMVTDLPGTILAVLLLGLFAFAFDMQAYHAVADLLTPHPMTSRGRVENGWSKGRLLIFGRAHYLLVESRPVIDGEVDGSAKPKRRVFEVGALSQLELRPGDEVEVVHWPHTDSIVTLERTRSRP